MAVAFMTRADANGWRSDMESSPISSPDPWDEALRFLAWDQTSREAIAVYRDVFGIHCKEAKDSEFEEWGCVFSHWQPLPAPPVSEGG